MSELQREPRRESPPVPQKRCPQCQLSLEVSHWAYGRVNCPSCGGRLQEQLGDARAVEVEPYDSSTDLKFDLAGLLTPDQRREAWTIAVVGLVLLLAGVAARLMYVGLGQYEFWGVPRWFDALVVLMLVLGSAACGWAGFRIWRNWRVMRRC
jgi:hypothetical protein